MTTAKASWYFLRIFIDDIKKEKNSHSRLSDNDASRWLGELMIARRCGAEKMMSFFCEFLVILCAKIWESHSDRVAVNQATFNLEVCCSCISFSFFFKLERNFYVFQPLLLCIDKIKRMLCAHVDRAISQFYNRPQLDVIGVIETGNFWW